MYFNTKYRDSQILSIEIISSISNIRPKAHQPNLPPAAFLDQNMKNKFFTTLVAMLFISLSVHMIQLLVNTTLSEQLLV